MNSSFPIFKGQDGRDGIIMWISGTSYNINTYVERNNKIYKSITEQTSEVFVDNEWELINEYNIFTDNVAGLVPAPSGTTGYLKSDGTWEFITGGTGLGTVTKVSAGNGMNFSNITTEGEVVMGTPSDITSSSTNNVSSGSHSHALDNTGVVSGITEIPDINIDNKGRIVSATGNTIINGLTKANNSIKLGGDIIQPTLISANGGSEFKLSGDIRLNISANTSQSIVCINNDSDGRISYSDAIDYQIASGSTNNNILATKGYVDDISDPNFVTYGIVTGTSSNDYLVTKGYVDDVKFNPDVTVYSLVSGSSNNDILVTKGYVDDLFLNQTQILTSDTTILMDVRKGKNSKLTLGHNATLTLQNLIDGDEGNIIVTNSGTFTLAISPTPYVINGGGGTISLTSNGRDVLSYFFDGVDLNITYGTNYTNA